MSEQHPESVLVAYMRGELTAADRARVDAHLAACAACREAVVEFRVLRDHVAATMAAAPEPQWARYRAEVRARVAGETRRTTWLRPLPVAAGVVAIALVSALVLAGRALLPNGDGLLLEDAALAGRLDLLQQYSVVERLDLLEDLDVIRNLDRLNGTREG